MVADMELRHLRYFVAVAEEQNLTRAALRLRVAQPALSRQMKDLETELEATLFDRTHAGVQLTLAGKAFYQRARSILSQATEAANEVRTAAGVIAGQLTVGFPSGIHLNQLVPAIDAFKALHPKVEFDYVHGYNQAQVKMLRAGLIDVAFINASSDLDKLEHEIIWRVPYKVVLPEKHKLAKRKQLTLLDLLHEDMVFCTREAFPEFYDDFHHHCTNAGFRPRIIKEVGGYLTNALGLVSVGMGLSVGPHFERAENIRGIVWRPLIKPELWVDFALVWRRESTSTLLAAFIETAIKTTRNIKDLGGHL